MPPGSRVSSGASRWSGPRRGRPRGQPRTRPRPARRAGFRAACGGTSRRPRPSVLRRTSPRRRDGCLATTLAASSAMAFVPFAADAGNIARRPSLPLTSRPMPIPTAAAAMPVTILMAIFFFGQLFSAAEASTSLASSIARSSFLVLLCLPSFIFLLLPITYRIMCHCLIYEIKRTLSDSYFQKKL